MKLRFCMMGNKSSSLDFDTAFFNKYVTTANLSNRGAFGTLYGPILRKNKPLAIKQVMFAYGKSADEIRKDIEEMQLIWNSLEHKHLMRILSVNLSQLPKVMYIMMEFAVGGSLNETLHNLGSDHIKLPIDVVTDWTRQIAEGMIYLHEKNIVHRDLKPSNILLTKPFNCADPRKEMTLKITDFDDIRKHNHTTTMSFVGTIRYMAPEVLQNQRFSKASDRWSFGVLTWEMLSGDIPYNGLQPSEIIFKSLKGELLGLYIEPSFPEDYKFILTQCWKSICEERLSFQQIRDVLQPPEICGVTSLNQEVFVSRKQHPIIEIYYSKSFACKRLVIVNGMKDPANLVSCSINNCLYAADRLHMNLLPAILRIDPINGNLIRAWNIYGHRSQISVANDSHLIVSDNSYDCLLEYRADGKLIRTINLNRYPDRRTTRSFEVKHAVKLDNGLFVVCQSRPSVVYLLSTKETCSRRKFGRIDEVEILKKFSTTPETLWPDYLSVDNEGSILVWDEYNKRAVLLSSNLDKASIIDFEQDGVKQTHRTCFDESTGKWLISDGYRIYVCRVEGKKVDKEIYMTYQSQRLSGLVDL